MKLLQITIKFTEHVSIEDVDKFILMNYPNYKIMSTHEPVATDILEDGTKLYKYYVNLEREVNNNEK